MATSLNLAYSTSKAAETKVITADPNRLMEIELDQLIGELPKKNKDTNDFIALINAASIEDIDLDTIYKSNFAKELKAIRRQIKFKKKIEFPRLLTAAKYSKLFLVKITTDSALRRQLEFSFKFFTRTCLRVISCSLDSDADSTKEKKMLAELWLQILIQAIDRLLDTIGIIFKNLPTVADWGKLDKKQPTTGTGAAAGGKTRTVVIDPQVTIDMAVPELVKELEKSADIEKIAAALQVKPVDKPDKKELAKMLPVIKKLEKFAAKKVKEINKFDGKYLTEKVVEVVSKIGSLANLVTEQSRQNFLMPVKYVGKSAMRLLSLQIQAEANTKHAKQYFGAWHKLFAQAIHHQIEMIKQLQK